MASSKRAPASSSESVRGFELAMAHPRENPHTKRAIERRIKAALAAGLKVIGVAPDGTILTEVRENAYGAGVARLTDQPKARDARELLR